MYMYFDSFSGGLNNYTIRKISQNIQPGVTAACVVCAGVLAGVPA